MSASESSPLSRRRIASRFWCAVSFGLRPIFTPFAHGAGAAFAGAGADQLALELGKPAKHGQDQAPVRRGGVRPCVAKRTEARAAPGDRRERVEQVARRSREPVKPRDQKHVAGVELGEGATKLRAVGARAARRLADHLAAPARRNCFTCASTLWPSVDTRA
jgi:hypothetical protein